MTMARTKAVNYSSQISVQLSFSIINSLLSATSILSRSNMAYSTIKTLEKLTCTNYVDFGKCQERFGRFSCLQYFNLHCPKDTEEELKLVNKVIDVVDRPNRRICVTLLRYKLNNPETSNAPVRLFGRKKEDEKFQQIVFVNYRLDEFVYLLDVMNSVYDKIIANKPNCIVL